MRNDIVRQVDSKGRPDVAEMSDREILEEICMWQRQTGDTLEQMMESFGTNPAMRSMMKMFGI